MFKCDERQICCLFVSFYFFFLFLTCLRNAAKQAKKLLENKTNHTMQEELNAYIRSSN